MEPINLSKDQIAVFGRPNFGCSQIAKILISSGIYAKGESKAEYEQAVVIHWTNSLLEKHGDKWAEVADELIKDLVIGNINRQKLT